MNVMFAQGDAGIVILIVVGICFWLGYLSNKDKFSRLGRDSAPAKIDDVIMFLMGNDGRIRGKTSNARHQIDLWNRLRWLRTSSKRFTRLASIRYRRD